MRNKFKIQITKIRNHFSATITVFVLKIRILTKNQIFVIKWRCSIKTFAKISLFLMLIEGFRLYLPISGMRFKCVPHREIIRLRQKGNTREDHLKFCGQNKNAFLTARKLPRLFPIGGAFVERHNGTDRHCRSFLSCL